MVRRLLVPQSLLQSQRSQKSEGTIAEVIDIMKPGSDENIKLGDPVPVVELDKIESIGRLKGIPSSDTPELTVPANAPDEEIRATAEVFKTLQKHNQELATIQAQTCQHPLVKQSIWKVEG